MIEQNYMVLRNILYAVESGDNVCGQVNYACFVGAYGNNNNETAITVGAMQWYATEAKEVLQYIRKNNPAMFAKLDTNNIVETALEKENWNTYNIGRNSVAGQCIVNILTACKAEQDNFALRQIKQYEKEITERYGSMADDAMMECVNIHHQGGSGALKRILDKVTGTYTAEKIYAVLQKDVTDNTCTTQVGDYTERQNAVIDMIRRYCIKQEGDANMTKTEKAIRQMEKWAKDNSHGYDQDYRWGEKGDYDCSSAVIQAWQNAGVPVKSSGATYTGDMKNVFLRNGFKDITADVNVKTGTGLKRGDVLLNEAHHVAMYCGNGKEVEASINEKGTAHGGQPGDQTGREFLIRGYRNYPWNCILRYTEANTATDAVTKKQNTVAYVARFTKDCYCYTASNKNSKSKLFPKLRKNAVVDVMKYTEKDSAGKKWYFVRIPFNNTDGFVFEFVPQGYFKRITTI